MLSDLSEGIDRTTQAGNIEESEVLTGKEALYSAMQGPTMQELGARQGTVRDLGSTMQAATTQGAVGGTWWSLLLRLW